MDTTQPDPDSGASSGGLRYPDSGAFPGGLRYPDSGASSGGLRYPDSGAFPGGLRDPDSGALSEGMLAGDPMTQFAVWMSQAQARGVPEPTAMVLATTSADGRPRARTVLLKAHDQAGFTFYTNRTSRKGRDLAAHPQACVVFPWHAIGRQVTAEGSVSVMSQAASEPYFHSRPRQSQIGAWASRQSQVIGSRAELDRRVAELERRWPPSVSVPMPDFWGGYLLVPETVEFWQAGAYRLHDRLCYRRQGDGWAIERLSP